MNRDAAKQSEAVHAHCAYKYSGFWVLLAILDGAQAFTNMTDIRILVRQQTPRCAQNVNYG